MAQRSIPIQAVAPVPPPGLQHLLQQNTGPGQKPGQPAQQQSFLAKYVSLCEHCTLYLGYNIRERSGRPFNLVCTGTVHPLMAIKLL